LVAVVAVGLATYNDSSTDISAQGTEDTNGPASFIGHASNAVLFVQWTRSGQSVTGSMREVITKAPLGSGLTSTDYAFTGVIQGNGLILDLSGQEPTAYVGEVKNDGFADHPRERQLAHHGRIRARRSRRLRRSHENNSFSPSTLRPAGSTSQTMTSPPASRGQMRRKHAQPS